MKLNPFLPIVLIIVYFFTVYLIPEDMFIIGGMQLKRFLLILIAIFNFSIIFKKYITNKSTITFNKTTVTVTLILTLVLY